MANQKKTLFLSLCIIVVLTSSVYFPFLSNGLVFDDHNVFTNLAVYDYAYIPFDFRPRTFPYFTLGVVQVLFGSIEAHRIVSLLLHILCSLMLFALLAALLRATLESQNSNSSSKKYDIAFKAQVSAFIGAIWFALNPVAGYGAGYLVQRTILCATLFSLLSLWFYRRAFAENRIADIVTAAAWYAAAVFSKEHAVLLPLSAVPISILYCNNFHVNLRRNGLFILLCLPAAIIAILAARGVVATSYEPYVGEVTTQINNISLLDKSGGPWLVSIILQANEFFSYAYYWLIPDVRFLSADMRIDFEQMWNSKWLFFSLSAFILAPFLALYGLLRGGHAALFSCGLLYSWLLFMTELSTVRFQEPFVLYRSYLWAPGFMMMLAAAASRLHWKTALAGCAFITPVFFLLAQDRLESLKSERTVWMDAADKLSSPNLPGADRIFYNRGGEYFKQGQLDLAMEDLNRVIALNPTAFQGYLGRGMIYLKLKEHSRALTEFNKSLEFKPDFAFALYRQGIALESLGRMEEALRSYNSAAQQGDTLAKLRLNYLKSKPH